MKETERDFRVKEVHIKLHFEPDDTGKVAGFQLEQFEGGVFAKKLN